MSAEKLVGTMEKLLKLHKSLYELAVKKTDILKRKDIDALNQTIKEEQSHIAAISKLEKDRQQITSSIVPGSEKPTIEDCLNAMNGSTHETLADLRSELLNIVSQIQNVNDLNQKLIFQSLQYVNFSLSLILPQRENFNYGPKVGKATNPTRDYKGLLNYKA